MQDHSKIGSLTVMKSELQNTPKVRSNHRLQDQKKKTIMRSLQNAHTCHNISKVPVLLAFKKLWIYRTNESGKSQEYKIKSEKINVTCNGRM